MNGKPIVKLELPLYETREVESVMHACRVLDCTFQQLLEQALAEYMDNHNLWEV
jgi:hypothetical protein